MYLILKATCEATAAVGTDTENRSPLTMLCIDLTAQLVPVHFVVPMETSKSLALYTFGKF